MISPKETKETKTGTETGAPPAAGIFIETDFFQKKKKGESAAGDVFLAQKSPSGNRIIAALSDGLGSGIKANVLASLTATMISKFVLMDIPAARAAEIITNSLPVCRERGLAYATFTLVDACRDMTARIIEYDNPPLAVVRDNKTLRLEKTRILVERKNKKTGPQNESLFLSELRALPGDRIVFFSDGVTQAGLGSPAFPAGWGAADAQSHILKTVAADPLVSAGELARSLVLAAERADSAAPKDDISCAVIYFRKPRDLLVVTGPPFRRESDKVLARIFREFSGRKIISGGTSAQIIARELGVPITDDGPIRAGLPPSSKMEGADLVCEGIITLGAAAEELARGVSEERDPGNPASRVIRLFLDSDRITFVVGTKINEAHQDPTMPVELEIRRNVVKRIAALLEEKYLKATRIQYL
ncbi:MAG: serine/threonine-protein phosphatase [Spirochaetaceae bacterium]|jgi:hypothetical protein|nr:serine/threonine-protein phosphatase [Spirochaetaceae bacterium]